MTTSLKEMVVVTSIQGHDIVRPEVGIHVIQPVAPTCRLPARVGLQPPDSLVPGIHLLEVPLVLAGDCGSASGWMFQTSELGVKRAPLRIPMATASWTAWVESGSWLPHKEAIIPLISTQNAEMMALALDPA
jgi:hypothetical protein